MAREALWDTVVFSGLAFVENELEAERAVLCGPRYAHSAERQALRSGHVPSSLVLGGRRVKVERPRACSIQGHELLLPSWRAWSSRDPLDERGGMMILRWTAAGALEAERHFRKITGHRGLPKLVAVLRARDAAIDRQRKIDEAEKAA